MAKKLETPCAAPKRGLPWELKYDYAMGGFAGLLKAFLYAIREKYGAVAALKMYEKICKMGNRVKGLTNRLRTIFKLEGNDAETIGKWLEIWWELVGTENTVLERSKTINRQKVTKCAFKTEPKDISGWDLIFTNIGVKTINPKATGELPKMMCAGIHIANVS